MRLRATANVAGDVAADATLADMVNVHGKGCCAITLDVCGRLPEQQPYQGIVPLAGAPDVAAALTHYMRQSEQLDTCCCLA